MKKIIISIEGKKAKSEKCVFEEFNKLILNFFNEEWYFITIDARKKSKQDELVIKLEDQIEEEIQDSIDKIFLKEAFIVHDGDAKDQEKSLDETSRTISKYLKGKIKNTIVRRIAFRNSFGCKKNNLENEFLCKMGKEIIDKNLFKKQIQAKYG